MTVVVKVGGAAKGTAEKISALRAARCDVVVVHGAGPQISERSRSRGIEPQFLGGQRVTDAAVLEVVREALAEVNATLVDELAAAGVPAQGLFGALGGVPHGDERLGLVGRVSSVDAAAIREVVSAGAVPVLVPLASGLNVNADHAAAAVAVAIGARELLFLSDVPGVLDTDGLVIREITAAQAPGLIDAGHVTGGMIPKLHAGTAALADGVLSVRIGAETMVTA